MQEHRLNHTEFAERVGVTRQTVARWICNSSTPYFSELVTIVNEFRVEPSFFFDQESEY